MAAQHKRPGAKAKKERVSRLKQRDKAQWYRDKVTVILFEGRHKYDGYTGKRVALGIPPEEETA